MSITGTNRYFIRSNVLDEEEFEPLKVKLRSSPPAIVGLAMDPDYFHEVIKHRNKYLWFEAMNNEVTALDENGKY